MVKGSGSADKAGISPFRRSARARSRVEPNIAGVAVALYLGGPGNLLDVDGALVAWRLPMRINAGAALKVRNDEVSNARPASTLTRNWPALGPGVFSAASSLLSVCLQRRAGQLHRRPMEGAFGLPKDRTRLFVRAGGIVIFADFGHRPGSRDHRAFMAMPTCSGLWVIVANIGELPACCG